jgi:hypothetical protein
MLTAFPLLLRAAGAVVEAALPYMQHQASPRHFEFFGIDVIADHAGQVWLIKANRSAEIIT